MVDVVRVRAEVSKMRWEAKFCDSEIKRFGKNGKVLVRE